MENRTERAGQQQQALGQGAGGAHLSGVGAEAVDEVDMAPDGWKGGIT